MEVAAEKLFIEAASMTSGVEAGFKTKPFNRSAEALRHPKTNAVASFPQSLELVPFPNPSQTQFSATF